MRTEAIEKKSYWIKHVDAYRRGNFASKTAYCNKSGVSYHNFLYWYQKIIHELVNKDELSPRKLFVPIQVTTREPSISTSPLCTLEFKQGHRLKIHSELVLEKLINLLSK